MVNIKSMLYRFIIYLTIRSIKILVTLVNYLRIRLPSVISEKTISQFRTDMQNDLSEVIDSSYIKRHIENSSVKLTYLDIGARRATRFCITLSGNI